jgi:hypothetical protein
MCAQKARYTSAFDNVTVLRYLQWFIGADTDALRWLCGYASTICIVAQIESGVHV